MDVVELAVAGLVAAVVAVVAAEGVEGVVEGVVAGVVVEGVEGVGNIAAEEGVVLVKDSPPGGHYFRLWAVLPGGTCRYGYG